MPAPKLKDAHVDDIKGYFNAVVEEIKKMHSLGLVHGDLSEYNILDHDGPVLIDYSMGVTLHHPMAEKLLERDVRNVVSFFKKRGVSASIEDALKKIEMQ